MMLGTLFTFGKLEYKTMYGKKADTFLSHVHPGDVKSALCLVVNLFLEQTKVEDEESNIHDSLMKLIKTSAINKALHASSFGKVNITFAPFVVDCLLVLLLCNAYTETNANAAPAPWGGRQDFIH